MSIAPQPQQEERTWAAMCHLAGFAALVVPYVGAVVGPLVVWLIKKDTMPFVNDQGREAVNFQLSCMIYGLVSFLLMFVIVGFALLIGLGIFWLIEVIVASVNASNGIAHRYPLSICFIK
jgi:uncharacterized protein